MEWPPGSASSHSSYRPIGASAATSQPNPVSLQPVEEAEEDWAAPPPWPEPESDLPTGMSGLNLGQRDTHPNHPPYNSPDQAQSPYKHPTFASPHYQFTHPTPYGQALPHILVQPSQSPFHPAPVYMGLRPTALPQAAPPPIATRATPSSLPTNHPVRAPVSELVYQGPKPTIPKLIQPDPSEFARLRLALENLLPPDSTELFRSWFMTRSLWITWSWRMLS